MRMRLRWLALVLLLAVPSLAGAADLETERRAWREDYDQLRRHMESAYANLTWFATRGGIDVPALHARTVAALDAAVDASAMRDALRDFIRAFHDGHFQPVRPDATGPEIMPARPSATAAPAEACRTLGFRNAARDFSLPFAQRVAFEPLGGESAQFSAGIATTDDGRRIAVLRIPLFDERGYAAACEAVWPSLAEALGARSCEAACEHQLRRHVRARLTRDIADLLRSAADRGATALVLDLAGNGGGNDWAGDVARLLTAKTLPDPKVGLVRHPHSLRAIDDSIMEIDRHLARLPAEVTAERARLRHERARLVTLRGKHRERCDMGWVWNARPTEPPCSNLVIGDLATSARKQGAPASALWIRPLYVLLDGRSASATEYIAAQFQDAGAARIVGERSYGAGCGHINGVIPLTLRNSGVRLTMPNCARIRADGRNEVAGVDPDLGVPLGPHPRDLKSAEQVLDAVAQDLAATNEDEARSGLVQSRN
jgi:Peptidase family S41